MKVRRRPKSLHKRDNAALGLFDAVLPRSSAIEAEQRPDVDIKHIGHQRGVVRLLLFWTFENG